MIVRRFTIETALSEAAVHDRLAANVHAFRIMKIFDERWDGNDFALRDLAGDVRQHSFDLRLRRSLLRDAGPRLSAIIQPAETGSTIYGEIDVPVGQAALAAGFVAFAAFIVQQPIAFVIAPVVVVLNAALLRSEVREIEQLVRNSVSSPR